MQINEQNNSSQQQQPTQQEDIYSYPLPIRIKHPSWSARKGTYQQVLYYLKTISSPNEQILISGASYTVQTLLPYFQNLIQEKHAGVLLKGLQCVEQILILDKKAYSRHCIKSLVDKGIQYFPLLSQQRKAILQKFLDILELSKIQASFLKNKLNLPHEKSVMYVIEVIGVLNMSSLKSVLVNLSKKHQKKCVRELAVQIAEQLQDSAKQVNDQGVQQTSKKPTKQPPQSSSTKQSKQPSTSTCKYTIQKLPHYEQLPSKKQQQYSAQLTQKIQAIIEQYTLAQLPNFSHILRLMIDDNNHIINMNAIKCLIAIFEKERDDGFVKNSLIPVSFPLLFVFNKFKSHKTHPINSLMLGLIEAILQSPSNRVNDMFLAISQGLSSAGSKGNVKFGCALAFFRIISLLYQNQDLYACTTNQNIENQNQDIHQKFSHFADIKIGKNLTKTVDKIITNLDKQKKYQTEMYLIKYAIGLDLNSLMDTGSTKDLAISNNKSAVPKYSTQTRNKQLNKQKKHQPINTSQKNTRKPSLSTNQPLTKQKVPQQTISLSKTLKQSKSAVKFEQINLELTLNNIIKLINSHNNEHKKPIFTQITNLLQKSSQQFYQCVRQKRYQMFYLCELLQHFIQNYQPSDGTIERVSQYLINLLKIISLLKPMTTITQQSRQISLHNVSQLLLVALCKLVISQEIHQVLQNLNQNYGFQVIFQCLEKLFVQKRDNKIKKKNKKYLLQWLQGNTPALYLNKQYYQLIDFINQKVVKNPNLNKIPQNKTKQQITQQNKQITRKQQQRQPISPKNNAHKLMKQPLSSNKKQTFQAYELQNINLSKIEKNITESNYDDQDMEKSSFHQNLQEHLRQIRTHRSYQDQNPNNQQDTSREYLRHLQNQQFKKKDNSTPHKQQNNIKILQQSPFKDQHEEQQHDNRKVQEEQDYNEKCQQVQRRRLQRQKERRQFVKRRKFQFKPNIDQRHQQQFSDQQQEQRNQHNENQQHQNFEQNHREQNSQQLQQVQNDSCQHIQKDQQHHHQIQNHFQESYEQEQILNNQNNKKQHEKQHFFNQPSPLNNNYFQQQYNKQQEKLSQKPQQSKLPQTQQPDCSFVSSTSSGQFKYKQLNQQKILYMLKSTGNPYHHLRNLILIPFKGSPKKHHFLKQLLHFFTNHVEFKIPQPYTSLILLTILMFSQIKQDKTLIQPLQSLYEFLAKQSTTNDFIKTIITLFHTVIEQTLPQNRKFLITILLKSMIRMLPFIEDGLSLLRDIQQFYQIGEMVYFQMFEQEYNQIRSYMEDEAVHIVVDRAVQQEGHNLVTIVEGWLVTSWKAKVLQTIEQFQTEHSHIHQHEPDQQQSHQHQQQHYQSYI